VTQHTGLTIDRWVTFPLDQQILMIANEMNRGSRLARERDWGRLEHGYARVLQLVDLTVACRPRGSLLRELLRWRDLVAELYVAGAPDPVAHDGLFRCLLYFTPTAAQQIRHVLPSNRAGA